MNRGVGTVIVAALLMVMNTPVSAVDISAHLTWDDCFAGIDEVSTKQDLCAAGEVGPYSLVISVSPSEPLTGVNGALGYIDVVFAADDIPDFWQARAGGCANGSLTTDLLGGPTPPTSCPNPWSSVGGQAGAFNWVLDYTRCNNRVEITWIIAIPYAPGVTVDPAVAPTWSLFRFLVNQDATECSGCEVAACFRMTQVRITRAANAPGGDYFINPLGGSAFAAWQGDPILQCYPHVHGDPPPCPTPTVRNTWGQIKSLYR